MLLIFFTRKNRHNHRLLKLVKKPKTTFPPQKKKGRVVTFLAKITAQILGLSNALSVVCTCFLVDFFVCFIVGSGIAMYDTCTWFLHITRKGQDRALVSYSLSYCLQKRSLIKLEKSACHLGWLTSKFLLPPMLELQAHTHSNVHLFFMGLGICGPVLMLGPSTHFPSLS